MPRKAAYQKHRESSIKGATQWNRSNPERRAEITAKYRKSDKCKAARKRYRQARRAAHRNARVAWRDQNRIDAIYTEAALVGMTVDHIIPLRHPLICGLHCEDNLMIVSRQYNQRKSNKFTIR